MAQSLNTPLFCFRTQGWHATPNGFEEKLKQMGLPTDGEGKLNWREYLKAEQTFILGETEGAMDVLTVSRMNGKRYLVLGRVVKKSGYVKSFIIYDIPHAKKVFHRLGRVLKHLKEQGFFE